MGIHYSEFDTMFDFLKEEIPIALNAALEKWEELKKDQNHMKKEWIKLLNKKSRNLMDKSYPVGTAMLTAWEYHYTSIYEDCERNNLNIYVLREEFFEESLYELERYEDSLIDSAVYYCNRCGWFTWDCRKDNGYCNNFCIERKSLEDKCISEVE